MEELSLSDSRIEGIHFTNETKNSAFTNLKKEMEKGNLMFQPDIELQRQLNSVRKKVSASNNVVFEQPRNKKGHGDSVSALCYALYAGKTSNAYYNIAFI